MRSLGWFAAGFCWGLLLGLLATRKLLVFFVRTEGETIDEKT